MTSLFRSQCELSRHNCMSGGDVSVKHEGHCGEWGGRVACALLICHAWLHNTGMLLWEAQPVYMSTVFVNFCGSFEMLLFVVVNVVIIRGQNFPFCRKFRFIFNWKMESFKPGFAVFFSWSKKNHKTNLKRRNVNRIPVNVKFGGCWLRNPSPLTRKMRLQATTEHSVIVECEDKPDELVCCVPGNGTYRDTSRFAW